MTTSDSLEERYQRVRKILGEMESVAVAFSAGVDSTLVLKMAVDVLGTENVVAVTGRSESIAREEFQQACELAATLGVEHVVLETNEFENTDYLRNPVDRCYVCKSTLYEHLTRFTAQRNIRTIVDGINADDTGDYRPGIHAAREHHVRSPAAEAGLTKADIRTLSQRFALPTFDKPASPCLSSRVPYGEPITPEKLRRIEQAEAFLHEMGIRRCRVRHHDQLARIEVPMECLTVLAKPATARRIDERFRALGFRYVTLDLRGFRSGSLNEGLSLVELEVAVASQKTGRLSGSPG